MCEVGWALSNPPRRRYSRGQMVGSRLCAVLTATRSAQHTPPQRQNSQRVSAQGGFLGGNKVYLVVPWTLLLFFRTLMRGFLLKHQLTLRFQCASQRQLCSIWASMSSYARGQPPAGAPCRVARPAAGLRLSPSSSSSCTRRKVCSSVLERLRLPRACLC